MAESIVLPPDDVIAVRAAIEDIVSRHGRAVVKPVADGSSVGLFHVESVEQARSVADEVVSRSVAYLCEAFVSGPELTVGVAQGEDGVARVLCASEVRLDSGARLRFPRRKVPGQRHDRAHPCRAARARRSRRRGAGAARPQRARLRGLHAHRRDRERARRGVSTRNTLPGLTRASFIPQQVAARARPRRVLAHTNSTRPAASRLFAARARRACAMRAARRVAGALVGVAGALLATEASAQPFCLRVGCESRPVSHYASAADAPTGGALATTRWGHARARADRLGDRGAVRGDVADRRAAAASEVCDRGRGRVQRWRRPPR